MGFLDSLLGIVKDVAKDVVNDVAGAVTEGTSVTPDAPVPFGWKTAWLAIKANSAETVIRKLNIADTKASDWKNGIETSYQDGQVFITQPMNGYVLVVGTTKLADAMERLDGLAPLFDELQLFFNHDIVALHGWAKYVNGKLVRRYSFLGERGDILWNDGAMTEEELSIGLEKLIQNSDDDWEEVLIPGDDEVFAISAKWSVNTNFEEGAFPPSTGFVGKWN